MTDTIVLNAPTAPDFTLSDQFGRPVRLHGGPGSGPAVLVFYRGHWCPYCRRYLSKLRDNWPRFAARNVRLLAISPEPSATSRGLAEQLALPFPLLSDPGGRVIDQYGVRNGFRAARAVLPHASVFVLDPSGGIRFQSIDRNFKKRATLRRIFAALDEMSPGGTDESTG